MRLLRLLLFTIFCASFNFADDLPPILINKNFEGGSVGKIEKIGDTQFRLHVEGQCDERGRNRQASWYYFRMDNVAGRDLVLTLTDFVGEYNDKPGACPMSAQTIPVFSYDGKTWRHFSAMDWDDKVKEATLKIRPESNTLWVAHIAPYTHSDLLRLLDELGRSPHARVAVIGKTVQGRDLHLVTVTDSSVPDDAKKVVWLQARQHAWETGTSYVMEGALGFVTSDDARACELRRRVVFKFTPMMDPDGCVNGGVRFNVNGYDVNRHWPEVDLRDPEKLRLMPEIWHVKKAIFAQQDSRRIDVMINMHNEESGEWMGTFAEDEPTLAMMRRLFDNLAQKTTFDPSRPLNFGKVPSDTTNSLYADRKVPVLLMEQRITTGKKLGHQPTVEDRLAFGRQLITVMAETALEP